MTQNQRIEKKIDFYESHLKRIDDLLERSSKGARKSPAYAGIRAQITNQKNECGQFARHIGTLKQGATAEMQEKTIERPAQWACGMRLPSNWRNWLSVLNARHA